jgi:hypothetical protein
MGDLTVDQQPPRDKSKELPKYYNGIVGTVSTLAAAGSVVLAFACDDATRKILVSLWTVVPPVFFFVEFHWARNRFGSNSALFQDLKESQKMAQKIWAGMVAAMTILYLKHNH